MVLALQPGSPRSILRMLLGTSSGPSPSHPAIIPGSGPNVCQCLPLHVASMQLTLPFGHPIVALFGCTCHILRTHLATHCPRPIRPSGHSHCSHKWHFPSRIKQRCDLPTRQVKLSLLNFHIVPSVLTLRAVQLFFFWFSLFIYHVS
jgi:hypothetical protein